MSEDTKMAIIICTMVTVIILGCGAMIYKNSVNEDAVRIECLKQGKSLVNGNCLKVVG